MLSPPGPASPPALQAQRKKWDILRITLETTVRATASPSPHLPEELRELCVLPPQAAVSAMHRRSLALFTPTTAAAPDAAFLPSQVLATLAYSSLKLSCADVGRAMVEEWLARRGESHDDEAEDGYAKTIELYVLQLLPVLAEWDYAAEFLAYEHELPPHTRQHLAQALAALRAASVPAPSPQPPSALKPPPDPASPRAYSPAPSSSSSSSSLSTTSTHTVVPARGRGVLARMTPARQRSPSAASSTGTARPPKSTLARPVIERVRPGMDRDRSTSSRRLPHERLALARANASSANVDRVSPPTANATPLEVVRAYLAPYFASPRAASAFTFAVLFVLVPVLSFMLRRRTRARLAATAAAGSSAAGAADLVRRRLQEGSGGGGMLTRAWGEVSRAVLDTVRMAGSGLV